jgi:hypothetical protein
MPVTRLEEDTPTREEFDNLAVKLRNFSEWPLKINLIIFLCLAFMLV